MYELSFSITGPTVRATLVEISLSRDPVGSAAEAVASRVAPRKFRLVIVGVARCASNPCPNVSSVTSSSVFQYRKASSPAVAAKKLR